MLTSEIRFSSTLVKLSIASKFKVGPNIQLMTRTQTIIFFSSISKILNTSAKNKTSNFKYKPR